MWLVFKKNTQLFCNDLDLSSYSRRSNGPQNVFSSLDIIEQWHWEWATNKIPPDGCITTSHGVVPHASCLDLVYPLSSPPILRSSSLPDVCLTPLDFGRKCWIKAEWQMAKVYVGEAQGTKTKTRPPLHTCTDDPPPQKKTKKKTKKKKTKTHHEHLCLLRLKYNL